MSGFSRRLYALVRQIPPGQVATYGQLALLLGNPPDVPGGGDCPQRLPGRLRPPATGWSAVWAACQMPLPLWPGESPAPAGAGGRPPTPPEGYVDLSRCLWPGPA